MKSPLRATVRKGSSWCMRAASSTSSLATGSCRAWLAPPWPREIRKVAPELPVLFMSGDAEQQLRRQIDIENVHFIPKPFSVQQISDKVAAVLGVGR